MLLKKLNDLNPKPGGSYAGNNRIVEHVVPDFAIKIVDGELELTLTVEMHQNFMYLENTTTCLKVIKRLKKNLNPKKML